MAFVLGKINKGIGGAIGLAWEARAHHKEKKAALAASQQESNRADLQQAPTTASTATETTVSPSTSHGKTSAK